eukprot:Phypoly_transcript_01811.p1 GENE.Phypoly_transcript_01811~~Phypoly_transcript_01811.p1  ORF type:complete len:813 (+),score=146.93 Phypoly_transcript_01811:168-2606(+)
MGHVVSVSSVYDFLSVYGFLFLCGLRHKSAQLISISSFILFYFILFYFIFFFYFILFYFIFVVVCHVSVGGKHMAAVASDGSIWTWGGNDYWQLGREGWDDCVPRALEWSGPSGIGRAFMVACGESHTVALWLDYETPSIFTWGRGDLGALGNGRTEISRMIPHRVNDLQPEKVVQIACGAHHTAALTASGKLWIWGDNSKDQTFLGGEICLRPKLVEPLLHVTQVACGGYHTSALVSGAAELLLQHTKDGNFDQVENLISVDQSLVKCVDPRTGFSPIHWACQEGHERIVELLVENGADANAVTYSVSHVSHSLTPLHVCSASPKSVNCAKFLTDLPNIELNVTDSAGQTALHRAVNHNNEEVVQVLVQAGSDKRAENSQGQTPLHLAVKSGNYRIARYLVRRAAPITVHDKDGKTPLFYCSNQAISEELRKIAQNHDVFISYAHSDMAFARKVRMELERNCIKCWMDDQRLEAGSDWRADIGNGILAARLIVFLGSPTSIVSDWCLKELKMGEKNGKLIWPVWYQKAEVPTSVSVLFSTSKFLDLSTDELYEMGLPILVRKLKSTIEKLDRFEFIAKAQPRFISNFNEIVGKPFSYISYLSSDEPAVENLKYLLSKHGVIWVDEHVLPEKEVAHENEDAHGVDVNQSFWIDAKKKEEELNQDAVEVEAEGNEGIRLCSAFILVVSKRLIETKDKQIRKHLKYAEENHKPVVLIIKDFQQNFRISPEDPYFGALSKAPSFHFAASDLQNVALREESIENIKRVVYVVELLYKETVLAEKLRKMEMEKAIQLAEAQRQAEEEAKRKKKFARV